VSADAAQAIAVAGDHFLKRPNTGNGAPNRAVYANVDCGLSVTEIVWNCNSGSHAGIIQDITSYGGY
jgi:hypothetical protein